MKVFVSWSGQKSHDVAVALREWLPLALNSAEPFVSSADIYAGSRWQADIADELGRSQFGIVCVTAENQHSPWLNFEAGALAKVIDISRVIPLAVDLKVSDIKNPLGQFQAQPLNNPGILKVVDSLNASSPTRLPDDHVKRSVAKWWPDLQAQLGRIEADSAKSMPPKVPERSDRELLEEVLNTVRSLQRADPETSRGSGKVLTVQDTLNAMTRLLEVHEVEGHTRVSIPERRFVVSAPDSIVDTELRTRLRALGESVGYSVIIYDLP